MMVNALGHMYALPPGSKLHGPAAALQVNAGAAPGAAADGSVLLTPTEASAPVAEGADSEDDESAASSDADEGTDAEAQQVSEVKAQGGASSSSSSGSSGSGSSVGNAAGTQAAAAPRQQHSRRMQGIFGVDSRRELKSVPKYPFSAAGHLMFLNPDSSQRFQCSGTLVGTYAVLTAAHCVVARSGTVQQDIKFTAAETSHNHAGLGAANGVRVYFNSGYLGTGADWTSWDLGMVVLDRPLGVNSTEAFSEEMERLTASTSSRRSHHSSRHAPPSSRVSSASVPGTVGYAATPKLDNTALVSAGEC